MATILSQRKHTTIYRDDDHPRGPVVRKVLNEEYPSPRYLARFYNEHDITATLSLPGVRRCLEQGRYMGRYAIALEYIDGAELSALRVTDGSSLLEVLRVALQIAEILGRLHEQQIIHRDIKPENILIHATEEQRRKGLWDVTLIDFGLAMRFDLKDERFANAYKLEGTLSYISPEQSGRMNRTVDYRTDYYSLGATLYAVMAGRPPFDSDDPMELVYSHLVRQPTPLHQANPMVPKVVSAIVSRLLQKSPEERYQSAAGLCADLRRCVDALEAAEATKELDKEEATWIEPFGLGSADHSGRFALVEKLYGREQETQRLLDAFAAMGEDGARLICISGPSGTGKSALVKELYQTITAHKGHFLWGKFDQLQRNTPFLGFSQAFSELFQGFLTLDEASLEGWKETLTALLGQLGGALAPIIPNIELLLGPQPSVPPLEGAAGQHRLFYLMRQLTRGLATEEHPLVLFLDDLQWADMASLELLASLLTDPERGQLLIIGAYRDNEVDASHPLMVSLGELAQREVQIETLALGPLLPGDIAAMIQDATQASEEASKALAKLVHDKTSGNAFFVHSFLELLAERDLLTFDSAEGCWRWAEAEVAGLQVTDNVAELLADKIKQMPAAIQSVMQYAGCMGNQFDLQTLALLCEEAPGALVPSITEAMKAGLLRPIGDGFALVDAATALNVPVTASYRFAHDRVQQAAISLLSTEERAEVHWTLGQILLAQSDPGAPDDQSVGSAAGVDALSLARYDGLLPEQLFGIIYHLNYEPGQAATASDRRSLALLNWRAGRLAIQAGAYEQAMACCEIGLQLCVGDAPSVAWREQYQLTLELHLTLAEAASLAMAFARVRDVSRDVLQHARSGLDKARAYDALAMVDMAREDLGGAIQLGLKALAALGVRFPARPLFPHIIWSLLRTQRVLKGRVEELEQLPTLDDPAILAALSLIERLMPAAFRSGSLYFPLFVFELVRLSVLHGNSRHGVFGYASFAIAQCAVLKKYERGYRFARLACRLGERYPDIGHVFIFNTFIRHWREPLAEIPEHMSHGYRLSLEAGNMYQATWLGAYRIFFMFLRGDELTEVEAECVRFAEALKWDEGTTSVRLMLTQCIAHLTRPSQAPHRLEGEWYDEAYVRRRYETQNDATELGQFHILSMLLALLFGEPEAALANADEVMTTIEGLNPMPFFPLMHFLCALIHLELYRARKASRHLRRGRRHVKELVRLAKEGHNYKHLAAFGKAMLRWARGHRPHAADAFAEGLKLANQHDAPLFQRGMLQHYAARFHEEQGHEELALFFWKDALQCYREWGATSLVSHWQKRYPQLVAAMSTREIASISASSTSFQSTSSTSSTELDLQSLWKASAALTAEIVTERLLERLMHILIENAGAQRGALLLPHEKGDEAGAGLRLAAIFEGDEVEVRDALASVDSEESDVAAVASLSIIQYVSRTRQPLVLHDAQEDERFGRAAHIKEAQVRSVLCAPIVHQGRQTAVIYLENNMMAGAFTPQRLELVTLLSAQAGTALENAILYGDLEDKVDERTRELKEAMTQLVHSEKMASLGTLVAGVAHELNNPTNFAYSGSQNLRRRVDGLEASLLGDDPDPDARAMLQELLAPLYGNLDSIEDGAVRIKEIVNGLRTFSRLDEGSYKRVSLVESLESTLTLVHANYSEWIDFVRDFGDIPQLYCRPAQLNQVFMHIMVNGCQAIVACQKRREDSGDTASAKGQLTIACHYHGAESPGNAEAEHGEIEVRITDDGCGMSEDVQARIFEPFFTTKEVGSGAGLGLSIAFGIVQEHKGRIEISSTPEQGSTFAIFLPLQSDTKSL